MNLGAGAQIFASGLGVTHSVAEPFLGPQLDPGHETVISQEVAPGESTHFADMVQELDHHQLETQIDDLGEAYTDQKMEQAEYEASHLGEPGFMDGGEAMGGAGMDMGGIDASGMGPMG